MLSSDVDDVDVVSCRPMDAGAKRVPIVVASASQAGQGYCRHFFLLAAQLCTALDSDACGS